MANFTAGAFGVDFDQLDFGALATAAQFGVTPTSLGLILGGHVTDFFGGGFQFAATGPATDGLIAIIIVDPGPLQVYEITNLALSASLFRGWVLADDNASAKAAIFASPDQILGSAFDDRLRGFAGDDVINAGAGNDFVDGGDGGDQLFGEAGNDTVVDPGGANYLRGGEGDDLVLGGAGFDDINGNQGNDTASGGPGDDWVVGGKDNDVLSGDDGGDLVYGNLGDDTLDGGTGADTVRGGQGNDSLMGGAGADFVSGDRGDDTMAGGSGADIFHSSSDAGIDRVLDFSVAEGDRVQLDLGTAYTMAQVGADTVITMSAGQVVLVGVSMSSLAAGSVFLA
ncbi:MAG: calcium-binding protein [Caulobacterales bacterium]|nr:calcium-binding protein [Caulobacterales bacterium]